MNFKKAVINRYSVPILASLFVTAFCLMIVSSPTHAASDYDDSYHSIPNLTLQQDSSCLTSMPPTGSYYDTDYAKYILDENLWHPDDRNSGSDMYAARESFRAALTDENGIWGVSREQNYKGEGIEAISVYWSTNPNAYLRWYAEMVGAYDFSQVLIRCHRYNYWGYKYNRYFGGSVWNPNVVAAVATLPTDIRPVQNLFVHSNNPNFNYNYPSGYEGEMIPDGQADVDNDGLDFAKETAQGTSDTETDTDNDGINDLKESIWFEDRDDVFCGVTECAYPDPLKKDIYVEIDWMYNPANTRLFKPTATQIGILTGMYGNHGIRFHADIGEYGGGNLIAPYTESLVLTSTPLITDFGDLKSNSFSSDREGIWKYLIYGYGYNESPGSSGRAEISGDDIFVSGGVVEDNSNTASEDRAIAGTIAHEIGHTLCLSPDQTYEEQPSECIHAGIDNAMSKPLNYLSVMNYRYQLTDDDDMGVVDYSDGSHGLDDHNDWNAIEGGMADFTGTRTAMGAKVATENKTMDPDFIIDEAPMDYYVQKHQIESEKSEAVNTDTNMQRAIDTKADGKEAIAAERAGSFPSYAWILYVVGGVVLAAACGFALYLIRKK